jgi:hypothetical protein
MRDEKDIRVSLFIPHFFIRRKAIVDDDRMQKNIGDS